MVMDRGGGVERLAEELNGPESSEHVEKQYP